MQILANKLFNLDSQCHSQEGRVLSFFVFEFFLRFFFFFFDLHGNKTGRLDT